MGNFVHLHCHSSFSLLDGLGTPAKLAEKAKQLGFTALAQTDHGNCDGAIKFYLAMKKQDIKPIIGAELYVVDNLYEKPEEEKRYHMIVLCKNNKGFVNLMKMLTAANLDGFYRRPRIDMKLLDLYGDDLVILTGCSEGVLKRPDGIELAKKLKKKYGEDFYLEIMPHHYKPQVEMNNFLYKLSKELDIPLVSTNDNHYINKEDSVAQEVLLAIQRKADWKDPKRWKFSFTGLYMRTYDEMLAEYAKQGSDIPQDVLIGSLERTMEIADKCNVSLEKERVELPLPPALKGQEEVQALMDLCMEGWKVKFPPMRGEEEKVYYDRLDEELQAIINFGYTRYFLLVWDVRRWAREKGMWLGFGRGSAPSSFVCYLLGITGVDPIKYKLLFSRFIAKGRIDLPDIDLDFPDTKRDLVKQYLRDTYGANNVAAISTFMYLHGRSAIKDVARVFDVPLVEVNECTKEIIDYPPGEDEGRSEILESCAQFETVKKFRKKYPQVIKIAAELEGECRNKGVHAAGMVISSTPLNEGTKCVLQRMKGELVVNWDKYDLDYVGLIKLDVLGLNTLSMFEICLELIKKNHGIDLDLYSLEPNDKRVFEEFSKGETEGVFQFLSTGLSKYCERIGISDIEDLVALNALHRPGGLKSGSLESYEALKKGKKRPIYLREEHKRITEETFGLVIYQEQIMQIFYKLAGFSWEQADRIRKIVAKSQGEIAFNKYKKEFVDGCLSLGTLNRGQAEDLFKTMAFSAGYSFNRCVDGDTEVMLWGRGYPRKIKIKDLYRLFKGKKLKSIDGIAVHNKNVKEMVKGKILDVYYNGKMSVFEMTMIDGSKIVASGEHKFLKTSNEWVELKDIKMGMKLIMKRDWNYGRTAADDVRVRENVRKTHRRVKERLQSGEIEVWNKGKNKKEYPQLARPRNGDNFMKDGEVWNKGKTKYTDKRLLANSIRNTGQKASEGTRLKQSIRAAARIRRYPKTDTAPFLFVGHILEHLCPGKFKKEYHLRRFSLDYADPEMKIAIEVNGDFWHANPKIYKDKKLGFTQLKNIERDNRKRVFLGEEGWKLYVVWENDIINNPDGVVDSIDQFLKKFFVNPFVEVEVKEIKEAGERDVYDIEVEKYHNYIANWFVVHNSHAVVYTLLGYFCQYLKVYYPAEFILASLMTSDSDKQIDYIREARRLGMKVGTADINWSGLNWEIDGNTLLPGFLIIKGIGDKVAFNIMEFRNKIGVFKSFDHFLSSVEKKAVNKKSVESLVKAGAFDKMEPNRNILFAKLNEEPIDKAEPFTEEERMKQFDEVMPFEFNPDPLYIYRSLIKELGAVLSIIKIAEATKAVDRPRYFIGKMLGVDFSRKGQDVTSVYGEFEDEGGLTNLIFSSKVYGHYKEKIEKLAGKYILVLAGYSPIKGSMLADKLWLLDDIVNLNFGADKLILPLIKNTDLAIDGCSVCRECKLRNNAKSPVGVQKGKWNVMIVGDAPGNTEAQQGVPFVGSAGQLLNDTLVKYDLRRELFYVSYCVKCKPFSGPNDPKTPSLDLVRKCSELWLDNEIKDIAPKIIFATGNTSLYFFTGKETGISEKNATMQWNKRYGCWVIFAINPAAILVHSENQIMFDQAVRMLAEKIAYLL